MILSLTCKFAITRKNDIFVAKTLMAIFALATMHNFQDRLVIPSFFLHAKTLHALITIFQDSLDFGRIRGVLEDRRRKVIVRQVLSQI